MSPKRGPRSAAQRIAGLLEMVPWLMERDEVSVSEMARQFGISEDDLIADIEMAAMCGLPPYSPWELTEMWIEDGVIHTGPNKHLERRLRLSKQEAFGLALLARAALEMPNFKARAALKSALNKLESVNSASEELVDVDVVDLPFLAEVTEAARQGERIVIRYWKPSDNSETERSVWVRAVFTDIGNWYMTADDETSRDLRHFRIDRIRGLTHTDEFRTPHSGAVDVPSWFADSASGTVVTIEADASARWIAETYPCRSVEELADGRTRIEMVATSEHWLGRLLLRAGRSARVTAPAHLVDLGRSTASSVLDRYRAK